MGRVKTKMFELWASGSIDFYFQKSFSSWNHE